MPKPELYVVYTGDRKNIPEIIYLSKEFFGGADVSVEVKVQVICENDTDSIINQYIIFCKVYNAQMELYGRTRKTALRLIQLDKMSLEDIVEATELSLDVIKDLQAKVVQPV